MERLQKHPNTTIIDHEVNIPSPRRPSEPLTIDSGTNPEELAAIDNRFNDLDQSDLDKAEALRQERELVQRAQEGDPDALGLIFTNYRGKIERYVFYRLPEATRERCYEEIASEALFKAFNHIGNMRDTRRGFGPWIYSIAGNLVRDHLKSAFYNRDSLFDPTIQRTDSAAPANNDHIYTDAVKNIMEMMTELKPDQAWVLWDIDYLGRNIKDFAADSGRSEGATKALLSRARASARKLAHQLGYDLEKMF